MHPDHWPTPPQWALIVTLGALCWLAVLFSIAIIWGAS